jgi:acetyl esterase
MTIELSEALAALAPELAALLEAIAMEDGPPIDPTLLPPGEGRALAARSNARWNLDLPAMSQVGETFVPADAELGSAKCRVRALVPETAKPGAVLFVHGGGFAFCSPETHERCARLLARECQLPVLMPDYRLAPEHPYPAGLRDVIACLRAIAASPGLFGVARGPLLVAGDSAGANLALAAMLHEQRLGRALPQGGLLFYGVYGADHETPSHRRFADGPGLTTAKMRRYWDWYLPDEARRKEPLAAPLHAMDAELHSLPPLYLLAAGIDPLLSDTMALSRRLEALGRRDRVTIVPGMVHGFLQMSVSLGAARDAIAAAAAAARGFAETND